MIPMPMTIKDKEITAKALLTDLSEMVLRNTSIRSLPFAKLRMFSVATAKVLVFIPPPVEDGYAPIHINRKTIIVVGNSKAEVSTLLNPAVRGVAAPKSAVMNLPMP